MKHNYQDFIVQNVSVIIGSALIGLGVRFVMLEKGADQFTANSIFWIVILIGLVFYTALVLLGVSLFEFYKRLRNKNNPDKLNIQTETDEQFINPSDTTEINSSENVEILEENNVDTNTIREIQQQKKVQQENEKLQIALNYTLNQFALYVSNEDLDLLCNAVICYSKKENISNSKLIETTGLSNLDLYHFGWNIWNHFKPVKQEEVSKLLKMAFSTLQDIELDSIKSHLKDDPQKGIIKIVEDISIF
ncbi:hypothetical protein [Cloacibacterium caeni]|uniref:hypothetical protein n=1 Tax=Cloacibacterium caeni TaxID=2004710 RepID=UPI001BCE82A9|nr:hypothetical protein [Cloacibacterium caeni]